MIATINHIAKPFNTYNTIIKEYNTMLVNNLEITIKFPSSIMAKEADAEIIIKALIKVFSERPWYIVFFLLVIYGWRCAIKNQIKLNKVSKEVNVIGKFLTEKITPCIEDIKKVQKDDLNYFIDTKESFTTEIRSSFRITNNLNSEIISLWLYSIKHVTGPNTVDYEIEIRKDQVLIHQGKNYNKFILDTTKELRDALDLLCEYDKIDLQRAAIAINKQIQRVIPLTITYANVDDRGYYSESKIYKYL
jgi:hypothetical protein